MAKAIFCLASNTKQAEEIVEGLKTLDISNNDISILFPDKGTTRDFAHEKETKAPEGYTAGVGAGGVIGGVLGWLAGIGALSIPGIGPLIAAGPIMAALSGAAVGAALGGITGALIGLGIPEYVAKIYEGKIKEGNILICAHSEDTEKTNQIKALFANKGAHDISDTMEASVPKGEGKESEGKESALESTHADL